MCLGLARTRVPPSRYRYESDDRVDGAGRWWIFAVLRGLNGYVTWPWRPWLMRTRDMNHLNVTKYPPSPDYV